MGRYSDLLAAQNRKKPERSGEIAEDVVERIKNELNTPPSDELSQSIVFTPPHPEQAHPDQDQKAATPESRGAATPQLRRAVKPERRNAATPETQAIGEDFDINAAHDAKGTFMLTDTEYDALSDLKRPLGRQLGVKVSLHDLARCAVNQMLEDYEKHGDQSFLVRHLKRKRG